MQESCVGCKREFELLKCEQCKAGSKRESSIPSTDLLAAKKTMIRALRCLYVAVEKDVADDVAAKVRAYTDMLEAANAGVSREERQG